MRAVGAVKGLVEDWKGWKRKSIWQRPYSKWDKLKEGEEEEEEREEEEGEKEIEKEEVE